jgi:hypothetical protein
VCRSHYWVLSGQRNLFCYLWALIVQNPSRSLQALSIFVLYREMGALRGKLSLRLFGGDYSFEGESAVMDLNSITALKCSRCVAAENDGILGARQACHRLRQAKLKWTKFCCGNPPCHGLPENMWVAFSAMNLFTNFCACTRTVADVNSECSKFPPMVAYARSVKFCRHSAILISEKASLCEIECYILQCIIQTRLFVVYYTSRHRRRT